MKIVSHFGKYYPPDYGGIENITEILAVGIASTGKFLVKVICFQRGQLTEVSVQNNVHIFRAPATLFIRSQPLALKYLNLCLKHSQNIDLIHLHAPNMLAAIAALLIPRSIPLLVHWHSDVVKKGLLGYLIKPLEVCLLSRANLIVATSESYANFSKALRTFKNKVVVIPLGIADPKTKALTDQTSQSLPNELFDCIRGRRIILSVGRLVPYKGFDVLIEACGLLDEDSVVVIVGEGPATQLLSNQIQAMGLENKVFLMGKVDNQLLHALFSNAYLFCLPSVERSEAFGVVLLEALASGLPIVATNIEGSGVPWVNMNGVTGINVPVRDAKSLADACNFILSSPLDRARYSSNARSRYLSEFTDSLFIERMNALYYDLLMNVN